MHQLYMIAVAEMTALRQHSCQGGSGAGTWYKAAAQVARSPCKPHKTPNKSSIKSTVMFELSDN